MSKAANKVLILVIIMMPPTRVPNRLVGMILTNHAAMGAAIKPPMIKAMTHWTLTCVHPNVIRKPKVEDTAIANSLVSTEPMTFLGSILLLVNNTGVAIGPQPPPPVASKKPAIKPSGINCFFDIGFLDGC